MRRIARALFWAALLGLYAVAVLPQRDAPSGTGWDKANHALAFLLLATLFGLAHPGWSHLRVLLLFVGFGILIELTQALPFVARDASVLDVVADTVGIVIALVLTEAIARLRSLRRSPAG